MNENKKVLFLLFTKNVKKAGSSPPKYRSLLFPNT